MLRKILLLTLMLVTFHANAEVLTGSCGTNLTYNLNTETGVLKIDGTGEMTDFKQAAAPWNDNKWFIKEVVLASTVTTIGDHAFYYCSQMTSCPIPSSVTKIGSNSFGSCSKLSSVDIPASVASIGNQAFYNCKALMSINVDLRNANYCSVDGVLFSKDKTELLQCPGGKAGDYTIPDAVVNIREYSLSWCRSLENVVIPEGVQSIGEHAFYFCSILKTVTIPSSVIRIGNSAFTSCDALNEIRCFAYNVPSMGRSVFFLCNNYTSGTLYVPSSSIVAYQDDEQWNKWGSIEAIDDGIIAPGSCGPNLTYTIDTEKGILRIDGTGEMTNYSSSNNAPWKDKQASIKTVIIGDAVTTIGNYAFNGCYQLTSCTTPASVTTIGDYAFYNCNKLTSCPIPSSVTRIGNFSFDFCNSLPFVTIPASVTAIGDYAFSGCGNLTTVSIPATVLSLGVSPFGSGKNLTSIEVEDGNPNYCSVDGVLFNKDMTELIQFPAGKDGEYAIPDGVNKINIRAFYYCSSLGSVVIPKSVRTIDSNAFEYCTSLVAITIPEGVEKIGTEVFQYCRTLKTVIIPASVKSIDRWAFWGCTALSELCCFASSIPLTGANLFYSCQAYTSGILYVPEGSIAAYQSADQWKKWGTIKRIPTAPDIKQYLLGRDTSAGYRDINNDGLVTVADIAASKEFYKSLQHEYVDLGLPSGTFWATCNVGADVPEEFGNYFAWGEITGYSQGKSSFSWSNYQYGTLSELTKYTLDGDDADNLVQLEQDDDAAYAKWGRNSRIPSRGEWDELLDASNCTWTWNTLNGVSGYTVTSVRNSQSIFIPAAGSRYNSSLSSDEGCYWSSSLSTANSIYASALSFGSNRKSMVNTARCSGLTIRSVR